jgi:hypothetical protein
MLLKLLFGIGVLYCIHYWINVLSINRKKNKRYVPKDWIKSERCRAKVEEYQNN